MDSEKFFFRDKGDNPSEFVLSPQGDECLIKIKNRLNGFDVDASIVLCGEIAESVGFFLARNFDQCPDITKLIENAKSIPQDETICRLHDELDLAMQAVRLSRVMVMSLLVGLGGKATIDLDDEILSRFVLKTNKSADGKTGKLEAAPISEASSDLH